MREKIKIDRQLKENNRGVYGIFLIRCDDLDEQCAYIGKVNSYLNVQNNT